MNNKSNQRKERKRKVEADFIWLLEDRQYQAVVDLPRTFTTENVIPPMVYQTCGSCSPISFAEE